MIELPVRAPPELYLNVAFGSLSVICHSDGIKTK